MIGASFVDSGRRIVTVTEDKITTWDTRTLRRLHSTNQPVTAGSIVTGISPNGRTVARPTHARRGCRAGARRSDPWSSTSTQAAFTQCV
jgi:hypothetical protein